MMMMSDKRRKRKPMSSSNSSHDDKDYHSITISDGGSSTSEPARRRSDSLSKAESWMTKVTSAMSQRIFTGSRKLGTSRSTQVMPMASTIEQDLKASSALPTSGKSASLRQVSSEQSLQNWPIESIARVKSSSEAQGDNDDDVYCIAPEREAERASEAQQRSVRTVQVRSNGRSATENPKTGSRINHGQDEEEEDYALAKPRTRILVESGSTHQKPLADAAPILKDFFTKSATSAQETRSKERQKQREIMYKRTKQRQDHLRQRLELDLEQQEAEFRRIKAEELRKLTQARRRRMREEASRAREQLLTVASKEVGTFELEREKWEQDFQEEMRKLSLAWRRASRPHRSALGQEEVDQRPMTVAGLAVPEALSQLQRDASNYEKRIKSAVPSARLGSVFDGNSARSTIQETSEMDENEAEDTVDLEESYYRMGFADAIPVQEDSTMEKNDMNDIIRGLLEERERLLQRIDDLEKLVAQQQQSAVVEPAE